MGELTKCNYCSQQRMELKAKERGVKLIVIHESHGAMRGWYSARYSDEKEPQAYFMQLTQGCVC